MNLTIAERWQVTFRVQSLARVTYPPAPALPARQKAKNPDLVAIAQANRLHDEMEAQRQHWRDEAHLTIRRMF